MSFIHTYIYIYIYMYINIYIYIWVYKQAFLFGAVSRWPCHRSPPQRPKSEDGRGKRQVAHALRGRTSFLDIHTSSPMYTHISPTNLPHVSHLVNLPHVSRLPPAYGTCPNPPTSKTINWNEKEVGGTGVSSSKYIHIYIFIYIYICIYI